VEKGTKKTKKNILMLYLQGMKSWLVNWAGVAQWVACLSFAPPLKCLFGCDRREKGFAYIV